MPINILRLPSIKIRSGLGRSTIYAYVSQGLWTKPVSLGARAVGWPDFECDLLVMARISGKNDAQIRELVQALHAKRKGLTSAEGGV